MYPKKNFPAFGWKIFLGYTWIHLDTPGNCQVLPDTPERPEKCPRVWFLGPGVSRSFQGGGNCEKKISWGGANPGITQPARMILEPVIRMSPENMTVVQNSLKLT